MNENLRIVHCANFSTFKNGQVYYSMDRKISHGLIENGHLVYDFSYRDIAKAQRFLAFKKKSIEKMNLNLIDTCKNLNPDVLLLGKCELITSKTLKKIKENNKKIKIVKWFVDFLETENDEFFNQFYFIDCFFQTNALKLKELSKKYPHMTCSYLPNISDKSFEKKESNEKKHDVIYIARDNKDDVRYRFALRLKEFCDKKSINLKLYGSLGNPELFGREYYEEISRAKIAINFNRSDFLESENTNKLLGTSDRMNHFLGIGTCTFSPKIKGLENFYRDNKEVVYFNGINDCLEKIEEILKNKEYIEISKEGRNRALVLSNAKKVTNFMLDLIFEQDFTEKYVWKDYIFKNGKKIVL